MAEYVRHYGRAKSRRKELFIARRMVITGGTVRKREQILCSVSDNLTLNELKLVAKLGKGLVVKIGIPSKKTADASFERRKNPRDPFVIIIRKDADNMAIAHEFIHLLRVIDRKRMGLNRTPYGSGRNYVPDARKLAKYGRQSLNKAEEAATCAETAMRVDKPGRAPVYYGNLGEKDTFGRYAYPDKKKNMQYDRQLLRTNTDGTLVPEGKAVKGVEALQKMERKYKDTRISNSTFGGKTAIELSKEAAR